MSRKQPEIKIVYPDASEAAMLLTEAMIKRSSGKRIVETTSEEKEYNGQELFAGALACKTDTSVELTLKLNPDATDYALATLIAKNLTEDEKRAIRMATTSMEVADLLSAHAAGAEGASTCTDEVGTLREPTEEAEKSEKAKIEIGKIEDRDLRSILNEMVRQIQTEDVNYADAIENAVNEINHREGANIPAESEDVREARNRIERYLAVLLYITPDEDWDRADLVQRACDANDQLHPLINQEYPEDIRIQNLRNLTYQCEMIATRYGKKLTGDILEEELEKIQKGIETEKPKKEKKRKNKADKSDKTDEANETDDIEPGLLNDIEDDTKGAKNG